MDNLKKEYISLEIIRVLKSRFDSFPDNSAINRNAPFHEAFLQAFSDKFGGINFNTSYLISLSSWLHGLNTTLGQTFFENVAHILSDGQKKEFTSSKQSNLTISKYQQSYINEIITDLKNCTYKPDKVREESLIFDLKDNHFSGAMDFTADNYIEEENYIEAIEIKSVRPNSVEMRGEKQKILNAKSALKNKFPDKTIRFYLGFPFDPTSESPTGYDKKRFMSKCIELTKFFAEDEILIADEFWNHLSGEENTMQQILDMINIIATPAFIEEFDFINDRENFIKQKDKFINLLNKWNLYREKELLENIDKINSLLSNNKNLIRVFNQNCFDNKYNYNIQRYYKLKELVNQ